MAIDLDCTTCRTDEHVRLAEQLTGTQIKVRCTQCGSEWLRGKPAPPKPSAPTIVDAHAAFAKVAEPSPERLAHVADLKAEFLTREPEPEANVAPYWAKYQAIFSAAGLPTADPQDLKDFANNDTGAGLGNMANFNKAWNDMGVVAASGQTRAAIDYLLRGPQHIPLEDRLTNLITDAVPQAMKGFKESMLTKVLCIVRPTEFLPLLQYSSGAVGKREIAKAVWDIDLPHPQSTHMTIGRLIVWSNDLLRTLVGAADFKTQQHAAAFLWWAKDQD